MSVLTLLREGNPLADVGRQREILERPGNKSLPSFQQTLVQHGVADLRRGDLKTLQINVGKLCNQTCRHCHVDAGPDRRELMTKENFEHCLRLIEESQVDTVDITGGAPEMNPYFEWFVTEVRKLNRHVIDRSNLTILSAPGFTHLPQFLADHQVEVVASLPCYLEDNCDSQRGDGVFRKSIDALKRLNRLGYARGDGRLILSLVYNPVGPSLPPDQQKLEQAYRDQLWSRFGIEFNQLYTITNMPISRFLDDLISSERYDEYMSLLVSSFNRESIDSLMCRSTVSIDWQGYLFDCDFNQMLDLPLETNSRQHISKLKLQDIQNQSIAVGRHCYGCTAGAGSSCSGALLIENKEGNGKR
jgi:radical SAM/Cys-rich protein